MNPANVQPGASWTARIIVSIVCLSSIYLIYVFMAFVWNLLGDNVDFPPTWYCALTIMLIAADVAAIWYLAFRTVRVLIGEARPLRLLKATAIIGVVLVGSHVIAVEAYWNIPQWDFQDNVFDDLSRPAAGRVSSDCRQAMAQNPNPSASVSSSLASDVEGPISYEEVQRIAQIDDLLIRQDKWGPRTIVGWRGWVKDVVRHGYYSNPDHHLVTLFLRDPYSNYGKLPEAVLSYFEPNEVAKVTVGQEVLLCGRIYDASIYYGEPRISIYEPVVNPLPLSETLTNTQIPADFSFEYEAHGCGDGYSCREYEIQVNADGNLTYQGMANVLITGTHTIQIPKDKIKQLVFELRRTKFLSIEDLPEKVEGDLQGATILRARLDGRSKTIFLPWRGPTWPISVHMLIGKVEEISDLQQWVNMVTSP